MKFLCESYPDYLTSNPPLSPLNAYSSYGYAQMGANGFGPVLSHHAYMT